MKLICCIILGVSTLAGCAHDREFRLYVFDANRQLFIRNMKNKDVLTVEQADGLICQKPEDVKKFYQKTTCSKKDCKKGESDGR